MQYHDLRAQNENTVPVAVIVPTLNEAPNLLRLLPNLQKMRGVRQIIICDGGSSDATLDVARKFDATIAMLPQGSASNRGAQLTMGAQRIDNTIKVLWFLHADARPHPQSAREIGRTLQNPEIIGGNFRLRFDSPKFAARGFETIARAQRHCGVYYGDSGVWVRRETYQELEGFREWPLFEDFDFTRRLELLARGSHRKTACLHLPLMASSRRFEREPWRVLWLWAQLQIRFWRGADPEALAQMYRRQE
jgi:glycosyltransferase involved in cell wall biosynthesis